MQWLTLIPEDPRLRGLKPAAAPLTRIDSLSALKPYPDTHDVGTRTPPPGFSRAYGGERRRGERRRVQQPVILDTRCGDERRSDDSGVVAHIDLFA